MLAWPLRSYLVDSRDELGGLLDGVKAQRILALAAVVVLLTIGVLSHFRNYAWHFRRSRRFTCAVAGACAWAGNRTCSAWVGAVCVKRNSCRCGRRRVESCVKCRRSGLGDIGSRDPAERPQLTLNGRSRASRSSNRLTGGLRSSQA